MLPHHSFSRPREGAQQKRNFVADETTDAASQPVTESQPQPETAELPTSPEASRGRAPVSISEGHAVEAGSYDASAIQVLEGLEAVRKRPGMYIGSTGERGLHHLVWEVVDNSVDESLAGYCDRIVLTLQADGGVRVEDNGRGIPTDVHPTEGIPAVTMALTLLHAGGKFGGGGYKVSGGLHGVGISVVNALSSRVIVEVKNRDHLWRQTFSVGVPDARARAGPRDGGRREHRHHDHLLRLRRHLRDHPLQPRDGHQPDPRVRLPQQGPRDRGPRRAAAGVDRRHRRRHAGGRRRGRAGGRGRGARASRAVSSSGASSTTAAWSTTSTTSTAARTRPTRRSSTSRRRRPSRPRTT